MKNILYSIIVPVYNCELFLDKCLNSLINQSYKNIEIILINDGSLDSSESICLNFIKKDSRIKYYKKNNGGVSSARNYGLQFCSGDYVTFLDSDDYLDLCTIEYINSYLINNDIDIIRYGFIKEYGVFSKKSSFSSPKNVIISRDKYYDLVCPNIVTSNDLANCTTSFIKKSIVKELNFDSSLKYGEDRKFVIEAFSNSNSIIFLDKYFYHYVDNLNSATNVVDCVKLKRKLIDVINSNISSSSLIKDVFGYFDNSIVKSIDYDIKDYLLSSFNFFSFNLYKQFLNNLFFDVAISSLLEKINYNYNHYFNFSSYLKLKILYLKRKFVYIFKKIGKCVMKFEKNIFKSLL